MYLTLAFTEKKHIQDTEVKESLLQITFLIRPITYFIRLSIMEEEYVTDLIKTFPSYTAGIRIQHWSYCSITELFDLIQEQ